MKNNNKEFLGELRLGRTLTSASQTAAGGLVIWIGLLFLLSDLTTSLAGVRAPLAGFFMAVVLGLTLVNVIELLGGSGERGGTYVLVHETIGGVIGLLTGWAILAGCITLFAAMLQEAAAQLLNLVGRAASYTIPLALVLAAALIIFQVFQWIPRFIPYRYVIFPLLAVVIAMLLVALPAVQISVYQSAPQLNLSVINHTTALLVVSYVVFETLLMARRQIHDPQRHLPRAIAANLVFGGLLFIFALFVISGAFAPSPVSVSPTMSDLSASRFLPIWLIETLAVIALILAANACMMTAVRQMHSLSREGAFPQELRRLWRFSPMPPMLFVLLAILTIPVVFLARIDWLVSLSAALFLVAMSLVNVAAITSHRVEPERRRSFVVPFAPLVPTLAIAANLVLLHSMPLNSLWSAAVWLTLGGVYYVLYARYHQVVAQEGEVVFGRIELHEDRSKAYRILVPIGPGKERHLILRMAGALSHQLNGEVIPLQIITVPDPLAIEEGRRTARERNALFQWSTHLGNDVGVPFLPITRLARSVSEGIIDTASEEECNLILLSWSIEEQDEEADIGAVVNHVTRDAPCDVAVVTYRPGKEGLVKKANSVSASDINGQESDTEREAKFQPSQILVPTSGGPNAPLAIRLALLMAHESEATVTAIYAVDSDATDEEIAEGEARIQQTIDAMREQAEALSKEKGHSWKQEEIPVEGRVIRAPDVVSGIAGAGSEYDLLLIGSSEESLIDQMLFGNIPEQVARRSQSPVIIVKRYRGLPRLWLTRAWNALYDTLPTLDREEQIEVYRNIHRDARPDVDFFVMIGLSALIATFGLLQNSAAVIIGAMLVAPLFSPLLAISLSIIQGNVRLLRLAIESTVKGIALAIFLSALLALTAPSKTLTPEILSRGSPNLFDLAVALASGAAGAYAIARKDVAAALPGVAIAAALVPPLGVIGIGIAMGDLSVAGGGSLLFLTNLVAIALAGAVTFLLLGFRPGAHGARDVHLRRGLLVTIIMFVLITIPLGLFFVRSVRSANTRSIIENSLVKQIQTIPNLELVNSEDIEFQSQGNELIVTVPVYTFGTVSNDAVDKLSNNLSTAISRPVLVRLVTYPVIEAPSKNYR